jgi:hypothetical protein
VRRTRSSILQLIRAASGARMRPGAADSDKALQNKMVIGDVAIGAVLRLSD